jgi:hypothetical protein
MDLDPSAFPGLAPLPAPDGMEPLFPELGPPGARPVEVMVTVPEGRSRRCVMHIVASEDDAAKAVSVAMSACRGVEGFEVTARRFAPPA